MSIGYKILLTALAAVLAGGCASVKTPPYGVRQGELGDCPDNRACVSSHAASEENYIEPLHYVSGRQYARAHLLRVIRAFDDAKIVSNHRNYIRATFPSKAVRDERDSEYYFEPEAAVDDVEFYFPPGERVIHVRSASRLGLLDLGENRERIERIRELFSELQRRR